MLEEKRSFKPNLLQLRLLATESMQQINPTPAIERLHNLHRQFSGLHHFASNDYIPFNV